MNKMIAVTFLILVMFSNYANAETAKTYCRSCISAFAENRLENAFYARTENDLPDLSVVKEALCPSLSEKYASSSDGTTWMYSSNYIVGFVDGKCTLIMRSPRGMIKDSSFSDRKITYDSAYMTERYDTLSSPILYIFY